MRNTNGSAILIVLVIVIIVGLAAFYYTSKPFSAKVNEAARQATQWTPENIKQSPDGYIAWAIGEVGKSRTQLDARDLALRTKKNEADRRLGEIQAETQNFSNLLVEAKSAYRQAEAASTWPVDLRGFKMDQTQLKNRIVEASRRIENGNKLIISYQNAIQILSRELGALSIKIEELTRMKEKLSTELELVKIKKETADIGAIEDQVNAIKDVAQSLGADTTEVSLDTLVKPQTSSFAESEFDTIMQTN